MTEAVTDGIAEALLVSGIPAAFLNVVNTAQKSAVVKMVIQSMPAVVFLCHLGSVSGIAVCVQGVKLKCPRLRFLLGKRSWLRWLLGRVDLHHLPIQAPLLTLFAAHSASLNHIHAANLWNKLGKQRIERRLAGRLEQLVQ